MSRFLQPELVKVTRNRGILTKDYTLLVDKYKIHLRVGAKTNGDSVPRLLRWLLNKPFNELCIVACLIHDNLYGSRLLPRHVADKLYLKLLLWNGYSPAKARLKYIALRMFGWFRWNTITLAERENVQLYISVQQLS